MGKKVSILIPLYNSAKYIAESIESAIAQTWIDKEIIVVDDGSTDDGFEIVEKYKSFGVLLYSQSNKGASSARNLAFLKSTGDYIQYLDADDILSPNKISDQMKIVEKYNDGIIISCSWGRFYKDINQTIFEETSLNKDWEQPIDWILNSWNGKGMALISVWLTPREIIKKSGGWNEKISANDDGEFFLRVLLNTKEIKYCVTAKVFYRSGLSNSLSNYNTNEKINSLFLSYQLYEKHILKIENSLRTRHALVENYSSFVYTCYPLYTDLIEKSRIHIENLGFKKFNIVGGKYFKILCLFIGFEKSLYLRKKIRQLLF